MTTTTTLQHNAQIQIVNQRKQDLERRLKLANNDKANLNAALDESGDKLLLLENLLNERDSKLSEMLEEINELRDSSSWLSNELEAMISLNERLASSAEMGEHQQHVNPALGGGDLHSLGQRKRSQLVEQLKELRLKQRSRLKASELMLIRRRSEARANSTRSRARSAKRNGKKSRRDGSLFDEMEMESSANDESSPSPSSNQREDDDHEHQRGDPFPLTTDWTHETLSEIFSLLVGFQQSLQQRKDSLASGYAQSSVPHLYSPNSATEDSGISADDSE